MDRVTICPILAGVFLVAIIYTIAVILIMCGAGERKVVSNPDTSSSGNRNTTSFECSKNSDSVLSDPNNVTHKCKRTTDVHHEEGSHQHCNPQEGSCNYGFESSGNNNVQRRRLEECQEKDESTDASNVIREVAIVHQANKTDGMTNKCTKRAQDNGLSTRSSEVNIGFKRSKQKKEKDEDLIKSLMQENMYLNQRLEEVSAFDFEAKASTILTNSADPMNPFNLSKNVENIYLKEWTKAEKALKETQQEIPAVEFLSKLLQDCYAFCTRRAKEPAIAFLESIWPEKEGDTEDWYKSILSKLECSEAEKYCLDKLRQKLGLMEEVTDKTIKSYFEEGPVDKALRTLNIYGTRDQPNELETDDASLKSLKIYVEACLRACWKLALCVETITFEFNVVGTPFKDAEKQYEYKSYMLKKACKDCNKPDGEVLLVVWPAISKINKNGEKTLLSSNFAFVIVNRLT